MPYTLTHILAAIILIELFRAYVIKNNKKFPRYYILIAMIGAILPDFDIGLYYILSFFGFGFLDVHKTFSHSIFIPLAIFLILHYWLGWTYIGLAIALGYISHLIADSLTIEGVNFLHPISKFHVSGFIRTGSFLETLFFLTVLGANLFVINYFYLNLF